MKVNNIDRIKDTFKNLFYLIFLLITFANVCETKFMKYYNLVSILYNNCTTRRLNEATSAPRSVVKRTNTQYVVTYCYN